MIVGRQYPSGYDCAWAAVDGNGHVAAFITGGQGPIPLQILLDGPELFFDTEPALLGLEICSDVESLTSVGSSFFDLVRRGIYVYDWQDVHRIAKEATNRYEQIAIPSVPFILQLAPSKTLNSILRVKFENIRFDDLKSLDVSSLAECVVSR